MFAYVPLLVSVAPVSCAQHPQQISVSLHSYHLLASSFPLPSGEPFQPSLLLVVPSLASSFLVVAVALP